MCPIGSRLAELSRVSHPSPMRERGGGEAKVDPRYLVATQYRDASNLDVRARLYQLFSVNPEPFRRWTFLQLELPSAARILEVGCGSASLWTENRERVPSGWSLTLTDFSPGMLEQARQRLAGLTPTPSFQVVDAQNIPHADGSFDAVIANHMLFHLPDRPRAFSEICRVLSPSGRLYATTNGERHLDELDELVSSVAPGIDIWQGFGSVGNFTLENGSAQLAPYFPRVRVLQYEDELRITRARPLIDYVLSGPGSTLLSREQVAELERQCEEKIARAGNIRITKSVGMFEATR